MNKKIKIVNSILIIISIFIGIVTCIFPHLKRMRNTGSLAITNISTIYATVLWVVLVGIFAYLVLYIIFMRKLISDASYENDSQYLKRKFENRVEEVEYRPIIENNMVLKILDFYEPKFYLRLIDNNTVDIIVKDLETEEVIFQTNTSDISFIKNNFEFLND